MKYPIYTLREGEGGDPVAPVAPGGDPVAPAAPVVAESFHKNFIKEDGSINQGSFANLPEHLKPATAFLSQYKSLDDFITGAWTTKQHVGKQGLEKLPEGASDDLKTAQRELINSVLDIPATPEAYGFTRPDTFPEEYWSDENAGLMAKVFHENHLEASQAKAIMEAHTAMQQGLIDKAGIAKQEAETAEVALFVQGFGPLNSPQHKTAIEDAFRAAKTVGIDLNKPEYGSKYEIVAAMHKLKSLISEDVLVSGQGSDDGTSGSSMAKANAIVHDTANSLHAKYHAGDKAVREQVLALYADAAKRKQA